MCKKEAPRGLFCIVILRVCPLFKQRLILGRQPGSYRHESERDKVCGGRHVPEYGKGEDGRDKRCDGVIGASSGCAKQSLGVDIEEDAF